jgi:hypothetical protein
MCHNKLTNILLPCINYQTSSFIKHNGPVAKVTEERKITVVDFGLKKQAFYQSTGNNSNMPGTWFPCECVVSNGDDCYGHILKHEESILDDNEQIKIFKLFLNAAQKNNLESYRAKGKDNAIGIDIFGNSNISGLSIDCSRFRNIALMEKSANFGEGIWNSTLGQKIINLQQWQRAIYKVDLEPKTESDPEQINCWLREHGIVFNYSKIGELLHKHGFHSLDPKLFVFPSETDSQADQLPIAEEGLNTSSLFETRLTLR